MNLDYHRKQAKRLLRAYRQGDPDARARVHAAIGEPGPISLTDVHQVIAVEHGLRSWAAFKRTIEEQPLAPTAAREERIVETALSYRPRDPVLVRVVHRPHRTTVTDDGAAIARAGSPAGWRRIADRLSDEIVVNIGRDGVISLPVVRVGPPEDQIIARIAQASLALYQELLDLDVAERDEC